MTALFGAGLGLGLFLAAQVGPVTLLIVRSVLRGGRALLVGLAMAAAVALVDVLYATLGLAGAARFLGGGSVRVALGLVSAAILIAIGARTAWIGFRARAGLESAQDVILPRRAFATAVAATALNPLTIALWTVSFPAAAPASADDSVGRATALLAGVAVGTTDLVLRLRERRRAGAQARGRPPAGGRGRRQRGRPDRVRRRARLSRGRGPLDVISDEA
jgi:putative LysE/RhtB family amino acid efflux pump